MSDAPKLLPIRSEPAAVVLQRASAALGGECEVTAHEDEITHLRALLRDAVAGAHGWRRRAREALDRT